jgi:enoyl-CoA hydratase/carnithine racemase
MTEFSSAVDEAIASDARAVIVRSASEKFFCGGADVKKFLDGDVEANMEMIRTSQAAFKRMAAAPQLFIAHINGHALGGGLEITLACDLRFGARGGYKLGVPEVTLGLLPGNGGTQRLSRLIGAPKALDLMVTGRAISPGEAHNLGVLNRLWAADTVAEKTLEYATRLANGATAAIGEIKLTTYEGLELPIADALARERDGIERLFATEDAKEGLSAFAEKRKAEFKGV